MNTLSRTLTGIALGVPGIILLFVALFRHGDAWIIALIYGLILLGLGIAIFFNTKEDDVEEIRK